MTRAKDLIKKLAGKDNGTETNPTVFIAGERKDLITADKIPCNVPQLNKALGGGFASKTIHVIYGTEGVGKTAIAFSVLANAQKKGYVGVYINTESSLPEVQMKAAEVDLDELIFINSNDSADEMVEQIYRVLYDNSKRRPNEVKLCLILDSLNGMVPESTIKREEKKGVASAGMAELPRLLSEFLAKITGRGMLREGSLFICIAQERVNLGAYGAPTTMSGGKAVRFMSKSILSLQKKLIKEKQSIDGQDIWMPVGHEVRFTLEKNNAAGRPTAGYYVFMYPDPAIGYEGGVDDGGAILSLALESGLIEKEKRKHYLNLPGDTRPREERMLVDSEGNPVSKKEDLLTWIKLNKDIKEAISAALLEKSETLENIESEIENGVE